MTARLAIVVSHPIQYIAPWHQRVAASGRIALRVFFCCDWGVEAYRDPGFGVDVRWELPLLEGYEHRFLPIRRRPRRLGFFEVDNPAVADALGDYDPHVVLVHGYAHATNWRVARWARRQGRPLLYYSDSSATLIRRNWLWPLKRRVVERFYGHVDGALYVSDNNLAYHILFGITPERLFRACYPVDRERLLAGAGDRREARRRVRERHGIPEHDFLLAFVGKYVARKRPLDLVEAVAALAGRGVPVSALLVGDGPERSRIEARLRERDLARVTLTGFVQPSALPEYYAASDALVLPSEDEAAGVVLSEAASFGLPLIVSNRVGYVGDHSPARPRENALVVPCGDREALAEAIERLCTDAELYRGMSCASEEISRGEDVSVAAENLIAAVEELRRLGPRRTPRRRP